MEVRNCFQLLSVGEGPNAKYRQFIAHVEATGECAGEGEVQNLTDVQVSRGRGLSAYSEIKGQELIDKMQSAG